MKYKVEILIILAFLAFFSSGVSAETDGLRERYPHLRREQTLDFFGVNWRDAKPNEYVFLIPAHFGAAVFVLIGNVIGTPAKAVYNLCTLNFKGDDYLPPVNFSTRYFGPVGGYLLGSPFWALEKVLYELPASAFSGKEEKYHFADDDDE
ncbi:MAG: hypothetical protein PHV82_14255 [Victivallaceae bacterium]|nr:hypothetical protein [Victivallaceae bacterium]